MKSKKKKWIPITAVCAAVILLAVFLLPQFFRDSARAADITTKTATVTKGTIETTVTGSGNLASEHSIAVNLPSGVTVDSVNVEAGDSVAAGDTLATLNAVSLQGAIANIQDELASLDSEIDDAKDDTDSAAVTSSVSGRVKRIFASAGDNTQSVVASNGALMVISIDGKMKVSFAPTATDALSCGTEVDVTLSDGTVKTGTVSALSADSCTVTLTDNGPAYGDSVTVSLDGTILGTGTLEINAPINIIGGVGTVESVDVSENESVSSGKTLLTLAGASESSEYLALLAERSEYEEVLRTLLKYAETNSIIAETAGTVGAVNVSASGDSSATDSSANTQTGNTAVKAVADTALPEDAGGVTLLSSSGQAADVTLADTLANTVSEIAGNTEIFINNPVAGNTPQSTVMPGSGYTGKIAWEPSSAKFEAGTQYSAIVTLTAQSGYRFAADAAISVTGAQIEALSVSGEDEGNTLTFRAVFPATEAAAQQQNTQDNTAQAQNGSSAQMPSGASGSGSVSSSGSGSSSSGASVTASSAASSSTETESALTSTAFTILTGDADSLTVSVDELDILSIEIGQEASVVLDALPDETFHGTVAKVSGSGNAQTGVTTYPVTITLDGVEGTGVKAGMNATATISIATSENVLLIPLDALQEMGSEQFVFVAGDSTDGEPGERRTVETGLSDGTNVEIISGLSEGEEIVYTKTSSTEESAQNMMPGGMGGMMQGGEPPQGMQGGGPGGNMGGR